MQQETELQYLKGKTTKFASAISACPLRPHESIICCKCIYIPSVSYPFATASLTPEQCKDLQTILMSRLLPRLGYHQHFPHTVAFGPEKYGGIGLQSLVGKQAVAKITFVIKHLRAENEI
eukprot:10122648-Ditylum_brightwellii.AAC.1